MKGLHVVLMTLASMLPVPLSAPALAQAVVEGRWVGEAWLREDRMPIELELGRVESGLSAQLMLPELIWRSGVTAAATPDGVDVTLPFGLGPTSLALSPRGHVLASHGDGLRVTLRRIPDPPYGIEQVELPTATGPRPATLYMPVEAGAFPGVVLAGGARAASRHHPSVVAWCHHFVRRRLACLVADRRPDGSGPPGTSDLERDAEDLAAALRFLRAHESVDAARVGLASFSRGGWPALRLAAQDRRLAFLLLVAPPALSPAETEMSSVRARMEAAGRTAQEIAESQRYYDLYFDVATGRQPWSRLDRAARAVEGTPLGEFLDQPLRPADLEFWRSNARFDNRRDMGRVTAPVLALWGENDVAVPPDVHRPRLRASLAAARSVTSLVLPNADHSIEVQPGRDALGVWQWPSRAPRLIPTIDEWLAAQLGGERG